MKKIYLLVVVAFLSISVFGQSKLIDVVKSKSNAHKNISALAVNFTTTDLNGNSHTLYDYLNSGKTVMLDLYATWCSPCWSYSQNGALEDVYNTYGPNGTGEMMVFGIESDPTTDTALIYNSTLGNWTTGVSYPMINDDFIADDFGLTYFPYIIMICPNGEWFEAGQGITAYYTAAEYLTMSENCVGPLEVPFVDFFTPEGTISPNSNVDFTDNSLGLPTSWTWTFQSGTPATSPLQNPAVMWTAPGTYDVTLVATNANGSGTPVTKQITVLGPGEGLSFEDELIPTDWTVLDQDGDTHTWEVMEFGGSHGDFCLSSASWQNNVVLFPNNWFISPNRAISTGDILKWKVYAQDQSWVSEKYQVLVSTTTNAVASFTNQIFVETLTTSTGYMTRTVDLSAYAGQNIYVAFNHYDCSDWFRINLDEIVMPGTTVGVSDIDPVHPITIYPNPSTGVVNINHVAGAKVVIYNLIGKEVYTIENANQFNTVDFSEFGMGTYFVKVVSPTETSTHVIAITK
jgi:PKD repeat protein